MCKLTRSIKDAGNLQPILFTIIKCLTKNVINCVFLRSLCTPGSMIEGKGVREHLIYQDCNLDPEQTTPTPDFKYHCSHWIVILINNQEF